MTGPAATDLDAGDGRRTIGIGLVGSGFMGRAHACAFRAVDGIFPLALRPALAMIADTTEDGAAEAARALGFRRGTADWRRLVADDAVDLVAIATPNALHAPIALAAIARGKPVYCEKPLATTLEDAIAMTRAAEAAGVVTMMGFNYLKNPMLTVARDLVRSGELGTVTGFRGVFAEDFMTDPRTPFSWRCEPAQAGGALADLGSHLLAAARFLLGDIESVFGRLDTIHAHRPDPVTGAARAVAVDDQAAMLVRFRDHGFTAALQTSWLATGETMQFGFELRGTRGAVTFSQERFNELRLHRTGGRAAEKGFTTICASPAHAEYGAFIPAPGHQIGFNDLKVIEVKRLLEAVAGGAPADASFRDALAVTRATEAIRRADADGRWVALSEIPDA